MSKSTVELPFTAARSLREQETVLARLMSSYTCYAFVANRDQTAARAMFRGRWTYEAVAEYLVSEPTTIVMSDERASGFASFRLYGLEDGCPVCLAEIEIYFARSESRTSFWCQNDEGGAGALSLAA